MEVLVRVANEKDISDIVKIENATFECPWTEAAIRKDIEESDDADFIVATTEEHVIGYIGCWFIANEVQINNIAVREEFKGLGVGTMMMKALKDISEKSGAVGITLEVRDSNEVAKKLYRKMGRKN